MLAAVLLALGIAVSAHQNLSCKVFPGDKAWPSTQTWASLNQTTGGALIRGVPRASTCYSPGYDADDCDYLTSQWNNSYFQYVSSC